MIDASHGNSGKDFRRQPAAARAVAEQVAAGEVGIIGVMLESFLVDDRQDFTDRTRLTTGQSITDACMGWEMTVPVLQELASAVRARRALLANQEPRLSSASIVGRQASGCVSSGRASPHPA
jgi:3-deoxy-7-phosphoheptulonate synthase